jgi:hypothetical protein
MDGSDYVNVRSGPSAHVQVTASRSRVSVSPNVTRPRRFGTDPVEDLSPRTRPDLELLHATVIASGRRPRHSNEPASPRVAVPVRRSRVGRHRACSPSRCRQREGSVSGCARHANDCRRMLWCGGIVQAEKRSPEFRAEQGRGILAVAGSRQRVGAARHNPVAGHAATPEHISRSSRASSMPIGRRRGGNISSVTRPPTPTLGGLVPSQRAANRTEERLRSVDLHGGTSGRARPPRLGFVRRSRATRNLRIGVRKIAPEIH